MKEPKAYQQFLLMFSICLASLVICTGLANLNERQKFSVKSKGTIVKMDCSILVRRSIVTDDNDSRQQYELQSHYLNRGWKSEGEDYVLKRFKNMTKVEVLSLLTKTHNTDILDVALSGLSKRKHSDTFSDECIISIEHKISDKTYTSELTIEYNLDEIVVLGKPKVNDNMTIWYDPNNPTEIKKHIWTDDYNPKYVILLGFIICLISLIFYLNIK